MKENDKPKRKTKAPCLRCFLHKDYCICSSFSLLNTRTRVDLLVHYKELKRTTNTGRLVVELLNNAKIWVRGEKEKGALDHSKVLSKDHETFLLYPSDDAIELNEESAKKMGLLKPIQLLVPDGNWRQASKVHYRVSELKNIPRVRLSGDLADRHNLVRKESKASGMSTLESIGHVLSLIEGPDVGAHLLKAYALKKKATLKARGEK